MMKGLTVDNKSLAEAYIAYTDRNENNTFDDFFDYAKVPKEDRSDFTVVAILKQAKEIIKERDNTLVTNVARMVTRPGGMTSMKDIDKFDISEPDLIMATLMKSGRHLLKSNCVYDLVHNKLSDTLELIEVGEATIGKKWGMEYGDIAIHYGSEIWLTKEELVRHNKEKETFYDL